MKYLSIVLFSLIIFSCSSPNKSTEQTAEPVADQTEIAEKVEADSAYVFFKSPADGATVASPVFVEMGVSGMQIEPAGQVKEGFGHHHILINQASWPEGEVIPMSDSTIHYGKGQTDTTLELEPGEYTLSLQFANGVHASYGEKMATSITVTVE
ncbi:DUF4399 domain-containing protein [Reichenbachiella carrageenanivorans]|uniref:DUF4399 domain-containing protein n=1 Tax=Reichenbachiella carrageenanivorans TaxID=2979869 RepID=A0ABY6D215_9BACT|nr:DUF4399 domain-containing protein [Reichenbachiella carrageenanivorans]UXX80204.1 DUF4399 domain-containing protein [Reichenbachiella carrageenanivorans]